MDEAQELADAPLDLLESAEPEATEDAPLDIPAGLRKVLTDKLDTPVKTICADIQEGTLNLQPDFQRKFVWTGTKPSRLIESVLLDIPLPVIYLAEEESGDQVVVDGQQRLTTLRSFVVGVFPDKSVFRIKGLQVLAELNGKRFADLEKPLQQKILNTALRVILVKAESHPDVKFEVFERLNLGAEKLGDQELRNCMYRGSLNGLLHELAALPTFRKVNGRNDPHPRMQDCELVLRFLAMYKRTHIHFKRPLKQFLNRFMEEYQDASAAQLEEFRKAFTKAIDLTYHVFGTRACTIFYAGDEKRPNGRWDTKKLSKSLWDTILPAMAHLEKSQVVPVSDRIREELLDVFTSDGKFMDALSKETDNEVNVRYRAKTWGDRMAAVMESTPDQGPRTFSSALKKELFEADATCQICKQQIREIDDAEVDHIVHYWRGGQTIPENARLAHRYCNRARGGGA